MVRMLDGARIVKKRAGEKMEAVVQPVYRAYDARLSRSAQWILRRVEQYLIRFVRDPYMPTFLKDAITDAWFGVLEDLNEELMDEIMSTLGKADRKLASQRLNGWSGPPRCWYFGDDGVSAWEATRRLLLALRARFLYAQMPADGTFWKVIRDPVGILLFFLQIHPATSFWAFVLQFLLMERRDEYQLVAFVLRVQGLRFVSYGLLPAVRLGIGYHNCLIAISRGRALECVQMSPSSASSYPLLVAFQMARYMLAWVAFALLVSQGAYGGKEEIRALEYARLDAADGSIDGHFVGCVVDGDLKSVAARARQQRAMDAPRTDEKLTDCLSLVGIGRDAHGRWACCQWHDSLLPEGDASRLDERLAVLEQRRAATGVRKYSGGYLKQFMLLDGACTLILVLFWWLRHAITDHRPQTASDRIPRQC